MIPLDDGRDDATEETTPQRPGASGAAGPPPGAVSGVVRVGGARAEAEAAISPAPPPAAADDQAAMARELAGVTFPTAWRGYDPAAVDAYVRRVSQTLTALEEVRTPQDVVRRALDRVGEETAAILREAEEAAQRIITKSRSDAAERVQNAEQEAHEITQRARARLRDLDADIDRIWAERQRIIDDVRKMGERLSQAADQAEERYPPEDFEVPPAPPRPPAPPGKPALASVPATSDAPTQTISRVDPKAKSPGDKSPKEDGEGSETDSPPADGES